MSRQVIESDVLIVGSGPIGAAFARFLVAAGREVTMIDSGSQLSARPGEHLLNAFVYQHQPNISLGTFYGQGQVYSLDDQGVTLTAREPTGEEKTLFNPPTERLNFQNPNQNPNTNMPNGASVDAVGGMATIWSAYTPEPTEMERTPLIPAEEWPVLLSVAKELLNVHPRRDRPDAFEPSAVNGALRAVLAASGRKLENVPMAAERRFEEQPPLAYFVNWTGADTVLGPLLDGGHEYSQRFEILPQNRAVRLVRSNGRIDHALVQDLTTMEEKEIHAETFVVAANSIFTPRLLWQSGIRPWALGRFLNENTVATCSLGLNKDVAEALRTDEQNPARLEVIPIAWNDPPPKSGFFPTPTRPWFAAFNRTGRVLTYFDARYDARLIADLTYYGMVDLNPENRVVFDEVMTDRFGQPQVTFEYRLSTADAERADAMMAELDHVALTVGDYLNIESSTPTAQAGGAGPVFQPAGTSFHFQSTFRMGDEESGRLEQSVIDVNSKVWGFENLYLGGVGAIPNSMAVNPTLTACALAVRSISALLDQPAERLLEELL